MSESVSAKREALRLQQVLTDQYDLDSKLIFVKLDRGPTHRLIFGVMSIDTWVGEGVSAKETVKALIYELWHPSMGGVIYTKLDALWGQLDALLKGDVLMVTARDEIKEPIFKA